MSENGIDMSNLALMMLRWEKQRRALDELEAAIKDTVLVLERTQTVGNVRASYSAGRRSFDYETPGADASQEIINGCTTTVVSIDWRAVCKEAGIEPVVTGQAPPSVSLKLLA